MKIYIYKENEVSQFPPYVERPWLPKGDSVQEVDSPDNADFIICPVALHRIKSKKRWRQRVDKTLTAGMETLPYFKQYECKHVFFDCSDYENCYKGTSAILIRCNLRSWMLKDPNSIPWFWPVDDLKECIDPPDGGFKYEVGFHGWLSTKVRIDSVNSCKAIFGDKFGCSTSKGFFGHISDQEIVEQKKKLYLQNLQESKIMLCPQSIPGVFPYRFYEAMSAQRIPALFCTGYILPFQSEIDWDKCTLRFPAEQAHNAGNLIKNFLDNTSEGRLIEMSKYGRKMWELWLNRDRQPELVAYALNKKGGELGIIK